MREELLLRYKIEPRADYMYGHDKWLVVFDKKTQKYLKNGSSYARFKDTDEFLEYLNQQDNKEEQ